MFKNTLIIFTTFIMMSYELWASDKIVSCFDKARDFKKLSDRDRIALCLKIDQKAHPLECYKTAETFELSKKERLLLCGKDSHRILQLDAIDQMSESISILDTNTVTMRNVVIGLKKEVGSLNAEIQQAQKSLLQLKEEHKKAQEELQKTITELGKAQVQLAKVRQDVDYLRTDVNANAGLISLLRTDLSTLESDAESKMSRLYSEISHLDTRVSALE